MSQLFWNTIINCNNDEISPSKRIGHIFVYLSDQTKFLVFGGESSDRHKEIWTYCQSKNTN